MDADILLQYLRKDKPYSEDRGNESADGKMDYIYEPVLCYLLDGFLIVYCIVATAFFFKEKLSNLTPEEPDAPEDNGIYQELERPNDTDPYQVLEPTKRKKKAAKKKKPKKTPAEKREQEPFESVELQASAAAPPLPPL